MEKLAVADQHRRHFVPPAPPKREQHGQLVVSVGQYDLGVELCKLLANTRIADFEWARTSDLRGFWQEHVVIARQKIHVPGDLGAHLAIEVRLEFDPAAEKHLERDPLALSQRAVEGREMLYGMRDDEGELGLVAAKLILFGRLTSCHGFFR